MPHLRRELIINIGFLLLANILIKPYYIFFIERTFQNEAGSTAWGIYFAVFSLSMIPQIVLDLGLTTYVNKQVAGDRSKYDEYWKQAVFSKPLLSILFFLVFILIASIAGYLNTNAALVYWIGFNQLLLSAILLFRAFISARGQYRLDSIFSVLDKLIFILLFNFKIKSSNNIDSFLWMQTISLATALLLVFIYSITKVEKFTLSIPSKMELFKIFSSSLPYAFIFILMVLYCRMEPVYVERLSANGPMESGHYAAAYRILDAANMMGFLFAGLLLPMFSSSQSEDTKIEFQKLFELSILLIMAFAISISISIALHHKYIMEWLYTDAHAELLHIVILNLIPLSFNYIIITLVTSIGNIRKMNKWFIVSIGINSISNLILSPTLGAKGSAYAALTTQLLTSVWLVHLVNKEKLANINLRLILKIVSMAIYTGMIGLLFQFVPIPIIFKVLFIGIFSFAMSMISGLVPVKSLLRLLPRN